MLEDNETNLELREQETGGCWVACAARVRGESLNTKHKPRKQYYMSPTQCLTWVKTSDKAPVQNHDLDLLIRRTRDFDDCVFAIARYDGTWWIQDHAKHACSSWVEMETPPDSWADLSGKQ